MNEYKTRLAKNKLNRERAREGPASPLILLKYEGKDSQGVVTYTVVKEYAEDESINGWTANNVKGQDGAFYTLCKIADVDGALRQVVDGEASEITDFVVSGRVYKLEPDKIGRPLTEPKVWTLQGYDKNELYA